MARKKSGARASAKSNLNTRWLNNALKSIGSATAATFKDIAPNLYDGVDTVASAGMSAAKSIRRSGNSLNRLNSQLSSNKYIRLAKDTLNQSINDLKTGNLYNPDRPTSNDDEWDSMMDDFMSGLEDDSDGESSVTFNYIDNGDDSGSDGTVAIADMISKSSQAQLKATKANIDAMISLSSATLAQNQEGLNNIHNELINVNSNLTALLDFHEQNTLNFYQSAIAAFEKIGSSVDNEKDSNGYKQNESISDILKSDGSINIKNYKSFVKDQIKKSVEGSPAGMILPFLKDDDMLEMIVSDPVGGLTKGVIGGMIPKVIEGTLKEVDKTFSTFIPNMLVKLGKYADDDNATKFMQMLGKTFGLKIQNSKTIDLSDRFNGEAATFDDITRNSIVEVLPKYARESTQYLREIAAVVTKKNPDDILAGAQIFDLNTSSYKGADKLKEDLAKSIQESIVSAFSGSEFGKIIKSVGTNLAGNEAKAFEKVTNELFTQLAKVEGGINVEDFDFKNSNSKVRNAMRSVSSDTKNEKQAYKLIQQAMQYMYANNYGIDTATSAQLQASIAKENKLNELANNPEFANIISLGITPDTDMDEFVDKYTGNKRALKTAKKDKEAQAKKEAAEEREVAKELKANKKRSAKQEAISQIKNYQESQKILDNKSNRGKGAEFLLGEDFGQTFATAGEHAKNSMWAIMKGDTVTAGREFTAIFGDMVKNTWDTTKKNFLEPLKKTFFGEKDDKGYIRGGLFEVTQNKAKDNFKALMQRINGKDYVDSAGETHKLGEDDTSFVGEASKVLTTIKESVQYRLFGDKKDGEDGEKTEGILTKATEAIGRGLAGWKEAIFGGEEKEKLGEEDKKAIKESILNATPKAALGATAGMLTGMMTGSSLLGMMVGGPVGGAVLGLAGGILSNSEKFKDYLFGPEIEDENGKRRIGGVVSSKTQEFFKKNKKTIIGGATLGAVKGMIFPGAGLLTTMVGGPIAGAALGIGTGLLVKSETFQKFLWGDEEKGKEGVLQAMKSMFKGSGSKDGEDGEDKGLLKKFGMGVLGAGGGLLTGAMLSKVGVVGMLAGPMGPIGAAIAGTAVGLASQGNKFKNWMFGEKDEDGKRKGGLVGKVKNWVHVEVISPFAAKAANIVDDLKTTVKYDILENIRLPFLALRDGIKDALSPAIEKSKEMLGNFVQKVTEPVLKAADAIIFKPARKVLSVATDAIYFATKAAVSVPLKLATGIARYTKSKIHKFFKTITGFVKKGVVGVAKGIFGITKAAFGFGAKKIGNGINRVKNVASGISGLMPDSVKESTKSLRSRVAGLRQKLASDPWIADYYGTKKDRLEERKKNKKAKKDRDALVYNRRMMAKLLGYDVKDFTEENMQRATEEAKAQGKKIHWKKGSSGLQFDETLEEKREKLLAKTNAQIATEGETSTDPEVRAISQRAKMQSSISNIESMMRDYMNAGMDENSAREAAEKDAEEMKKEREQLGINEDNIIDYDLMKKKKKKSNNKVIDSGFADGLDQREGESVEEHIERIKEDLSDSDESEKEGLPKRIRGIFSRKGRRRAKGGDVDKGKSYLVGDGSPDPSNDEIFVPKTNGKILSQGNKGIKVEVVGFASNAINSIKNFFTGKGKGSSKVENLKDVVVQTANGPQIQQMTTKQASMYANAVDEFKDSQAAQLDREQDESNKELADSKGSYATRKAADDAAKDKAEKMGILNKILANLTGLGKGNKEHHSLWSKIFSKKGLIGGLLLAALPWIINKLPGLLKFANEVGSTIGGFVSTISSTVSDQFSWNKEHNATTNGESSGERLADNIEDLSKVVKDLAEFNPVKALEDFILDENTYDAGSGSRVNYLLNKGYDLSHSTAGKTVIKGGKKVVKGGAKLVKGAGKAGKKGVNFVKDKLRNKFGKKVEDEASDKIIDFSTKKAEKELAEKTAQKTVTKTAGEGAEKVVTKVAGEGAEKVVTKVAGEGAEKGSAEIIDFASRKAAKEAAKTTTKNAVKDAAETVVKDTASAGAKKVIGETVEEATEKGGKKGATKLINLMKTFLSGIAKKVGEKFPKSKGVAKCLSGISSKLTSFIKAQFSKITAKLSLNTGGRSAADAATLGLDKVVFCTVGAINGVSGAARLFYIDKDKVDGKMRAISAVIGALTTGTTIGSTIDIISSLMADILRIDLLNTIAVAIYKAISSDSDNDALDKAKDEFRKSYDSYQSKAIDKQYKTQQKAGLIGKDVTEEDFKQGIKDGKYKVSYKSYTDYNADKHQSIGYKMGKGLTNAGKGIKNFFAGKKSYEDPETGNVYADNGDDTFTVYDKDGKSLGKISKDAVDVSSMKESTKGGIKNKFKSMKNSIGKFNSKVAGGVKKGFNSAKKGLSKFGASVSSAASKGFNSAKKTLGKAKDAIGSAALKAADAINPVKKAKEVLKFGKWLVTSEEKKVYENSDGSYYDGKGEHYTAAGDKIGDKISLVTLSSWVASGLLTPKMIKTKKSGAQQIWEAFTGDVNKMRKKAGETAKKLKIGINNKIRDMKKGIDGFVTGAKNTFLGGKQDAWYMPDGSYYRFDGKKYIKCAANGEATGEELTLKEFEPILNSGVVKKGKPVKVEATAVTWAKDKIDKAGKKLKSLKDKAISSITNFSKKVINKGKSILSGAKKTFIGEKQEAWYREDGSYFRFDGKRYIECTAKGDPTGNEYSPRAFEPIKQSGHLKKGKPVKIEPTAVTWAKDKIDKAGKKLKSLKDKAISSITDFSKKVINKGKEILTGAKDTFFGSVQDAWYFTDGSYYRYDGKKFIKCTAHGDPTGEELSVEEFRPVLLSGEVKKGKPVKVEPTALTWVKDKISKAAKGLKSLKNKAIDAFTSTSKKVINKGKEILTGARNFFKSHTEKAWYFTDNSGYLVKTGKGYSKYNMSGDEVGSGISEEDFKSLMASGSLKEGPKVKVDSTIKKGFKSVTKKIGNTFKSGQKKVMSLFKSLNDKKDDFMENLKKNGFDGSIKSLFTKKKEEGYFRADGKGYYQMQSDGTYTYFNMNGDEISTGIKAEDIVKMNQAGVVKWDTIEKDSAAGNAIKQIKNSVKDAWAAAKDTVSSKWDSFKSWLSGGAGSGSSNDPTDMLNKDLGTPVPEDTSSDDTSSSDSSDKKKKKTKGGHGNKKVTTKGGRGKTPKKVNGFSYFSQNDSAWKNDSYTSDEANDGATIGDTGCGPTAMAMVANNYAKRKVTPEDLANLAANKGYRDSTGTNAKFIDYASDQMGMTHNDMKDPTPAYILQNVKAGNPVILNGISSNNGPFTKAGHYIVAVGTDKKGNILVNDPRGESFSKAYSPTQLADLTSTAWSYNKSANKKHTKQYAKYQGKKRKTKGGKGGSNFTAEDVIKVALAEVGYSEKASNSNLDDPKANPGSANYTKYARDVGHTNGLYWCATFVTWCFFQAANGNMDHAKEVLCGANTAGCANNQNAFKNANQFTQNPQPGDVVFFLNGGSSHTGLVVEVNGSVLTTVEGNTSPGKFNRDGGCVAKKTYNLPYGKISGYGRPKYDDKSDWTGQTSNFSSDVSGSSSSSASLDSSSSSGTGTDALSNISSNISSIMSQYVSAALTGNYNQQFAWGADNSSDDSSSGSSSSGSSLNLASNTAEGDPVKYDGTILTEDIKKLPHISENSIRKIIRTRLAGKTSVVSEDNAPAIAKAQKDSGISALALLGIATIETGLGEANTPAVRQKHNLWGWGATNDDPNGNAKSWDSVDDAFINYAAALDRVYYNKYNEHSLLDISGNGGGTRTGYAFGADGKPSTEWGPKIAGQIEKYLSYGLTTESGEAAVADAAYKEEAEAKSKKSKKKKKKSKGGKGYGIELANMRTKPEPDTDEIGGMGTGASLVSKKNKSTSNTTSKKSSSKVVNYKKPTITSTSNISKKYTTTSPHTQFDTVSVNLSGIEDLLNSVVSVLKSIDGHSEKLDDLNNTLIKINTDKGRTKNIIIPKGNSKPSQSLQTMASQTNSRNSILATKIAKGVS